MTLIQFNCIKISFTFFIFRLFSAVQGNNSELSRTSLEAHALSAMAAISKSTSGSSMEHLQMGHSLDSWLKGDNPTRKRLLTHSLLPLTASSYAQDGGEYNRDILVFSQKSSSIHSSADIKITRFNSHNLSQQVGIFSKPFYFGKLSMHFLGICDNNHLWWLVLNFRNPYLIRDILAFQVALLSLLFLMMKWNQFQWAIHFKGELSLGFNKKQLQSTTLC